jgi:predicted nucleic acid-binding protein
MFLFDSNIIIYSHLPDFQYLRDFILDENVFVSHISHVEVLGYHKLSSIQESYFTDLFSFIPVITPTKEIFSAAIFLRRKYNLELGDSIIAATARVSGLTIYTANLKDFGKVKEIKCINPVK